MYPGESGRLILRLIITLIVCVSVAGGVYALKQQQANARAALMAGGLPPAVVTDTRVASSAWVQRIEAVGDLRAVQDVAVASEEPGKLIEIAFESGRTVNAGDVLARLDAQEDRAQLEALTAELDLARLEYDRVRKLRGSAAFSQSLLDRTASEVANLEALAQRQRVLIRRKELRAPFDGVLGIRQVSLGSIVAAGDPIVQLQSLAPIYVDFTVPERYRGSVRAGARLEVSVAAWPEQTFSGTLKVVSPAVDVRSRTLSLRGEIDNAERLLQPGMFATVNLILSDAETVLTLPRTAISFFAYGESVFTINETAGELTVARQPIRVGRTRGERVEILSGLTADQRVVHTGHLKLRDGQRIVTGTAIALPQDVRDG